MDDKKNEIKKSSVTSSKKNGSGVLSTPLLNEVETPIKTKKKYQYCKIIHEDEQKDFDILYEYIRSDLLNYKKEQPLPTISVMRLKGMAQGTTMGDKRDEVDLVYNYRIILLAFFQKEPVIKHVLRTKQFKTEADKILYICKIAESILNDILILEQKKKWQEDQLQIPEENITEAETSDYFSMHPEKLLDKNDNNKKNKNGKFNDLW